MDAYARFHKLLKEQFAPLLRADGFKGSGNYFRRLDGDRVDIIGIQGSQWGGKCCVNLAAHYSFLPLLDGSAPDLKSLKTCECRFGDRLRKNPGLDQWWNYGDTDEEAEASIADLIDVYRRRSVLFFGKFVPFPNVFEHITPEEIDSGDLSRFPGHVGECIAAVFLARMMRHLGRYERCHEFAEIGLKHVGDSDSWKAQLEELRTAGTGKGKV